MKHKFIIGAMLMALLGIGASTQPVAAASEPTFSVNDVSNDTSEIRFGSNLLIAGNGVTSDKDVKGLLFTFGNQLALQSKSEYTFIAGNIIDYSAETEKDLFVAGNSINIKSDAKLGRDAYIAGNSVTVSTDLGHGSLSIAAARATVEDAIIEGNLNLDVAQVIFLGDVNVKGKIVINSDAEVTGLEHITYDEIERYEVVEEDITASTIWTMKLFSIVALFIAFAVILAMFPGVKGRVEKELAVSQFGKDVLVGMCVLLFVPIIVVFLIMSFVGAPAAIILLATYLIMIYLSQAFTGLWLGKLIVEKLAHSKINPFVEALIGITLLGLLVMIPWLGAYIGLLSMLLGLGLFMQTIKPNRKQKPVVISRSEEVIEDAEIVEPAPKSQSKESSKSSSTKSAKTDKDTADKETEITEED